MKECRKCKQIKDTLCFTVNRSKKDGLNSHCIACHSQYMKDHYRRNKVIYLAKACRRNAAIRKAFYNLMAELKARPCLDCNKLYPSYVMDFDHVKGKKKKNIARMSHIWDKQELLQEIAKCELVCANCHRIRTHNRKQSPSSKMDLLLSTKQE